MELDIIGFHQWKIKIENALPSFKPINYYIRKFTKLFDTYNKSEIARRIHVISEFVEYLITHDFHTTLSPKYEALFHTLEYNTTVIMDKSSFYSGNRPIGYVIKKIVRCIQIHDNAENGANREDIVHYAIEMGFKKDEIQKAIEQLYMASIIQKKSGWFFDTTLKQSPKNESKYPKLTRIVKTANAYQ